MATNDLNDFIAAHAVGAGKFSPYFEHNKEADALTMRFKPGADYSRRLTDHVTIFLSIDSNELVGCRIKGVGELLHDLPNFIMVDDGNISLAFLLLSFRGGIEDKNVRDTLNELARASRPMKLELEEAAG